MEYEKEVKSLLKELNIENLLEIEGRLAKDLSKLDLAKQLIECLVLGSTIVVSSINIISTLSLLKFLPEVTIISLLLIICSYAVSKTKLRSQLSRPSWLDRTSSWLPIIKRTKLAYKEKAVGVEAAIPHLISPENQLELLTMLNQYRASISAIHLFGFDFYIENLSCNLEKKQYREAMQDIVTLFTIVKEHSVTNKPSTNYYNKLKNMVYSQKKPTYKERL